MFALTSYAAVLLLAFFDPAYTYAPIAKPTVRIGSWNIQVFGQSKIGKMDALPRIIEILKRYDLISIQEIRDSQETAVDLVIKKMNEGIDPSDRYVYNISARLGRSTSKEQYAFVYRERLFTVKDVYQYPERYDKFERPPFVARFNSPTTEIEDFSIMNIHTSPEKAIPEINYLKRVDEIVQERWPETAILINGDFNADCSYVKSKEMLNNITMRRDKKYKWLINDIQDTTVKTTDCSYDRFVTKSDELIHDIVPGSIGVYNFDEALGLTQDEAEVISDHYPIELTLKGKIDDEIQKNVHSLISFTVTDSTTKNVNDVRRLYISRSELMSEGFSSVRFKIETKLHHVTVSKFTTTSVLHDLETIQAIAPNVISDVTMSVVKALLDSKGFTSKPYVAGLSERTHDSDYAQIHDILLYCALQAPYNCHVTVSSHIN